MAAMNQLIHSVTTILDRLPCEISFRYHLKKLNMDELEQKNTTILTSLLHHVLHPGEAYPLAIDFTNNPYYGTTSSKNEPYIVRSRRKKSTNEFYSYVTLSVVTNHRQMTLTVYPVRQGITKVRYIAQCLDHIAEFGLVHSQPSNVG